jgi:hypothetical protein
MGSEADAQTGPCATVTCPDPGRKLKPLAVIAGNRNPEFEDAGIRHHHDTAQLLQMQTA